MLAPLKDLPAMNRTQRKAYDKLQRSASFQKASPYKQAIELHRNGLAFLIPKDVYVDVSVPNLKPLALLNDCRTFREGEVDLDIVKIRGAYERLKDGSADEGDFLLAGLAINMAKVRALEISEFLANEIEKAQDAMNRCRERYLKHKRFGFDGPGIQAMDYAIEANEEILVNSSPKQMQMAADVVRRVLLKQDKTKDLPTLKV